MNDMTFTEILSNGLISAGGGISYYIGIIATLAAGYFLGSVNFAVIFGMNKTKAQSVLAFACDFIKGALAAFIGMLFMPADGFACVSTLACAAGHFFPIFFGFHGYGGAAMFLGAALVINPLAALISGIAFLIVLCFSKYMAASTVAMTLTFPIVNFYLPFSLFSGAGDAMDTAYLVNYLCLTLVPILIAGCYVLAHVQNIRRIIDGTEKKITDNQ